MHTADAADRVLIPHHRHIPLDPTETSIRPLAFTAYGQAMNWCETERANLVAATSQAARAGEHAIAWQLPLILWSFFTLRRFWADWITTYDIGLAAAQAVHHRDGQAWIVNNLGIAYRQLGQFEDALDHHQRALAVWREINDKWGEASTLTGQGNVYRALRRFNDAVDTARQAIVVWRNMKNQRGEGRALSQIGEAYQELGKHEEAINHLQQARVIRHALGERWGEARTLYTLGESLCRVGRGNAARESWEHALAIFEDLKSPLASEVRARLEALPHPHERHARCRSGPLCHRH